MNVLWITNIEFPEALELLTGEGDLKSSGGWMLGAADELVSRQDVSLTVATVSRSVKTLTRLSGKKITYYLLPYGKGFTKVNHDYEPMWKVVKQEVCPDIVHLHGTEYSHGLAYIDACGADNVVVSIQGLKSSYHRYYLDGLTSRQIWRHLTLRDLIKGTLFKDKSGFEKAGEFEKDIIRKVHHIIGRTSWDRSLTWAINKTAQYHFCNETLRSQFYAGDRWSYSDCSKHTIFLSQGMYPIKGLHMVLEALPHVLESYPDTKVRVAGKDITRKNESLKGKLSISGYGYIVKDMIRDLGLEDAVEFVGNLNAEEMKREYLSANVFICPSSIENSPNSLGEAQLLGTPVIASYVGGIPDMMKGDETHLYRFEETDMLASLICGVFEAGENQADLREVARERHDAGKNCDQLMEIYKSIS